MLGVSRDATPEAIRSAFQGRLAALVRLAESGAEGAEELGAFLGALQAIGASRAISKYEVAE